MASDVKSQIETRDREFCEIFARADPQALAALYTIDGVLLAPGMDVMRGRVAISGFWQGVFGMGLKEAELSPTDVEDLGQTAVEVGTYVLKAEGGVEADHGKYMVVWKWVDGKWHLDRDIYSVPVAA